MYDFLKVCLMDHLYFCTIVSLFQLNVYSYAISACNNKFVINMFQTALHYTKSVKALALYCTCIVQFSVYGLQYQSLLSNNCLSILIAKSAPTLRSFPVRTDWLPVYEGLQYMAVGVHWVQSSEIYHLMRLAEWCTWNNLSCASIIVLIYSKTIWLN